MKINVNKVIAIAIFVFVFFVPFRLGFITDQIVNSGRFIGYFMATLVGFLIAFGIGTNEPFGKKNEMKKVESVEQQQQRKAA